MKRDPNGLMGHKSLDTTLRYMHVNRDQKRAAIDGLSDNRKREAK